MDGMALCGLFAAICAGSLSAQIIVDPGGDDVTGDGSAANPYRTVSHAAAVASPGDTVKLNPGVYGAGEQIVLGDKDLAITGAGMGKTTVLPHATAVSSRPSGFPPGTLTPHRVAFYVDGPHFVEIRNLTIDCQFNVPMGGRLCGIMYRNGADGTIHHVEVMNVRSEPLDASQDPIGVIIRGDDNSDSCDVLLRNCWIHNWGKAGVAAYFNTNVTLDWCNLYGSGPVSASGPAQIGAQISYGAVGIVRYCIVRDMNYLPASYAAAGVMLYNAGPGCEISVNHLARCEENILLAQAPAAAAAAVVANNYSTGAYAHACRIDGQSGVEVRRNTLHAAEVAMDAVWDDTAGTNDWHDNLYSDWSGAGAYAVQGGGNSDATPGRGCAEFKLPTQVTMAAPPSDIVTGNFDGSGQSDFATANNGATPSLSVALESGGSYTVSSTFFGSSDSAAVAMTKGEFDGSPGVDLAVVTRSVAPASGENKLFVFANDGAGEFSLLHTEELPGDAVAPNDIAAGDLDNNGVDDVVVAHVGDPTRDGGGTVLLNGGDGTTWPATSLPGTTLPCKGVAIGPIDSADSSADIALTEGNRTNGSLHVYTNDGAGGFSEHAMSPFTAGDDPTAVALVDADGDLDLEILVAATAAPTAAVGGTVSILRNELPAGMTLQTVPTDRGPVNIATGDIDDDGDPDDVRRDAIIVNQAAGNLTLVGALGEPEKGSICLSGPSPVAASIAELTGDLYEDLLVADATSPQVAVYRGQPTGRGDVYGLGCPGYMGRAPFISTRGAASVPNDEYAVTLLNARPLAPAVFIAAVVPGPDLSNCHVQIGPILLVIPVSTDANGEIVLPVPLPVGSSLFGAYAYYEFAILDPEGAFLDFVSLTQGIRIRVGV